jgi:2-iminobutanoate/2-iminopropanoate deaminase
MINANELAPGDKPVAVAAGGYVFAAVNAADVDGKLAKEAAASVADETRICLEKLVSALKPHGLGLHDLVKVNCYLADNSMRAEFWGAYNAAFEPGPFPVRVTYAAGIASGCRVQLDAIALQRNA